MEADLAWHVRAWGRWVLARARRELAAHYPTYAEFEPLEHGDDFEPRPMRLLETDDDGLPRLDPLNGEFDASYLRDRRNHDGSPNPRVHTSGRVLSDASSAGLSCPCSRRAGCLGRTTSASC